MGSELIDAHGFLCDSLSSPGRGAEDPDDPQSVQAMQIALHLPKADLPKRTEVLAAAAQAVVEVCLDSRAAHPGSWRDALEQWYGHRIRKIARRARGAAWDGVQALPGCTAVVRGATARAFIPSAVAEVPHAISKLQIRGTDLPLEEDSPGETGIPTIAVDASLEMTAGKAAAQAGHGSMLLAAALSGEAVVEWAADGFPLQVREVPRSVFADLAEHPAAVAVQDSGFTEVAPGSTTVVALPGRYS